MIIEIDKFAKSLTEFNVGKICGCTS